MILAKFYDFLWRYSTKVLYHRSNKKFQNFTIFSFFLKDIHKLWKKIFFSNFWWIFRPIMVLDPKHGPKNLDFCIKSTKICEKKIFDPPPYRYVADMLELVHNCQKVCHNILCHILKVVWWYLTLVLSQTSKSTIFLVILGDFDPPPVWNPDFITYLSQHERH